MLNYKSFVENGQVHANGMGLSNINQLELPKDFISGSVRVERNSLLTLEGCPSTIGGDLEANSNTLMTLEGGPTFINGYCDVANNRLTNLFKSPRMIGGMFNCAGNQITSIEGCPNEIDGNFLLGFNALTSLEGIHRQFKGGYLKGTINLDFNPIQSHILGLLLIPELQGIKVSMTTSDVAISAFAILIKHFNGDADVIDCQQELIEAGLKEFAQL